VTDTEKFNEWLERKKTELIIQEPLSIQTNISVLHQRLWHAEKKLNSILRLAIAADQTSGFINVDDVYDVLERLK
jgi:hypothetical protein